MSASQENAGCVGEDLEVLRLRVFLGQDFHQGTSRQARAPSSEAHGRSDGSRDVISRTSLSNGRGVLVGVLIGAVEPVCRRHVPELISRPKLSLTAVTHFSGSLRAWLRTWRFHVDTGPEPTWG